VYDKYQVNGRTEKPATGLNLEAATSTVYRFNKLFFILKSWRKLRNTERPKPGKVIRFLLNKLSEKFLFDNLFQSSELWKS
jgi:hypothetical protein